MTPSSILNIIEIFLCVFYIAAMFGSGRSLLTDILAVLIFSAFTFSCFIGLFNDAPLWVTILDAIVSGLWASVVALNIKNPIK